jgi:hypothetical protein
MEIATFDHLFRCCQRHILWTLDSYSLWLELGLRGNALHVESVSMADDGLSLNAIALVAIADPGHAMQQR